MTRKEVRRGQRLEPEGVVGGVVSEGDLKQVRPTAVSSQAGDSLLQGPGAGVCLGV